MDFISIFGIFIIFKDTSYKLSLFLKKNKIAFCGFDGVDHGGKPYDVGRVKIYFHLPADDIIFS